MADGQPLAQQHRIRSATGEYHSFQVQARPLLGLHGEASAFFGAAPDSHARKQAEERQAFRLKFAAALRPEPTVDAVAHCALTLLSEPLQPDRN